MDNQELAKKMINDLSSHVNNMGLDENEFADEFFQALAREHRTLQASIVRVLLKGLVRYGENISTDLRNEAAKKACKAVSDVIRSCPIPFI